MKSVGISDHALIRWLERVHGVDMEIFRNAIREEIAPAVEIGASSIEIGGMRFCIHEGVLTTVLKKKSLEKKHRPPRWLVRESEEFLEEA